MQPKGFFKAKKIPDARIYYGDEVKINPADLFEFTEAKMGVLVDGEAGGVEENKENSGNGGGGAKEKKKKEDL